MQMTPILTLTLIAASSVTAQRFVDWAGNEAAADEDSPGVANYAAATGSAFAVNVLGTAKVTAGGAIAVGGPIKVGALGKAIAQGGTGTIIARAVTAAAADGDIIEVLLLPK